MTTENCESFLYILVFDSINFLLPDFFYLHFLAICLFRFIWGFFVWFFFRKSQKGRNIILAILDNIGLQKGKVKLFLNLLLLVISEMSFRNVL